MNNVFKLIAAIAVSELAAVVGAVFTVPNIPGWYAALPKPPLNPPGWVFGPVWITLYLLIGVAAYLVWHRGLHSKQVKIALGFWLFGLLMNVLWCAVFFGRHSVSGGVAVLAATWIVTLLQTVTFNTISPAARRLLIPYILWLAFASYLNLAIFLMAVSGR